MSAFIVSEAHVNALAIAITCGPTRNEPHWGVGAPWRRVAPSLAGKRIETPEADDATLIGQMLWDENQRSYLHRYSDETWEPFVFRSDASVLGRYSVVQLLKLVDCYEYQSCEHDEWKDSEARALCTWLRELLIPRLPGWNEAKWVIDDDDVPVALSAGVSL